MPELNCSLDRKLTEAENYKGFISSYMTNPTGQKGDARLCLIPIRLRIYNTQLMVELVETHTAKK